mmetsp:Transcript_32954/g.63899  ORF Transcript_32954/g.63899 Transcript_32954/m.63899 type:complete len:204 (+) Transcript_32954:1242-1853(+)
MALEEGLARIHCEPCPFHDEIPGRCMRHNPFQMFLKEPSHVPSLVHAQEPFQRFKNAVFPTHTLLFDRRNDVFVEYMIFKRVRAPNRHPFHVGRGPKESNHLFIAANGGWQPLHEISVQRVSILDLLKWQRTGPRLIDYVKTNNERLDWSISLCKILSNLQSCFLCGKNVSLFFDLYFFDLFRRSDGAIGFLLIRSWKILVPD